MARVTWPGTSSLNYSGAPIANSFVCGLSAGGVLNVRCGQQQANCIIDITGFLF